MWNNTAVLYIIHWSEHLSVSCEVQLSCCFVYPGLYSAVLALSSSSYEVFSLVISFWHYWLRRFIMYM